MAQNTLASSLNIQPGKSPLALLFVEDETCLQHTLDQLLCLGFGQVVCLGNPALCPTELPEMVNWQDHQITSFNDIAAAVNAAISAELRYKLP